MQYSLSVTSSINRTDRHDITEILLKVGIKHHKTNQIKPYRIPTHSDHLFYQKFTHFVFDPTQRYGQYQRTGSDTI